MYRFIGILQYQKNILLQYENLNNINHNILHHQNTCMLGCVQSTIKCSKKAGFCMQNAYKI